MSAKRLVLPCLALVFVASPLFAQRRATRERPVVTIPVPDRVAIPAGAFTMGANASGEPDEGPEHRVELAAFSIDRNEVMRRDYNACVRAGACHETWMPRPEFNDPRQPVVGISWEMARSYCQWAGGRLPTESEWEKAARGTDGRIYPWGNDPPTRDRAVYGQRNNIGHPEPVGSHPRGASPFGGNDMAGNVWEWTATIYDPYAYQRPAVEPTCESALTAFRDLNRRGLWAYTGALGIPRVCQRVLRGGAWNYWPAGLRSSNRVHHEPEFHGAMAGIRCAADVRP